MYGSFGVRRTAAEVDAALVLLTPRSTRFERGLGESHRHLFGFILSSRQLRSALCIPSAVAETGPIGPPACWRAMSGLLVVAAKFLAQQATQRIVAFIFLKLHVPPYPCP